MMSPPGDAVAAPSRAIARPERTDASRHLPSLDGVRGIAVLLVLAYHAWPSPWTAFGWTGVDLFFVLSGFLITGILFDGREDAQRGRTFYIRRVLRILPLYYAVLALMFIVLPLVHRPPGAEYQQLARDQVWYWTYTSNWLFGLQRPPHFNYMNHFWSLAVEEQFYLMWPVIVWHTSRRTAMRIAAGAIVGAFVLRIVLASAGVWWLATYFLTPCRMDGLAVGALIALALRAPGDPAVTARRVTDGMLRGAIGVAALAVTVLALGRHGFAATARVPDSMYLSAEAWIFGWLVSIAATHQPRVLQWAPLRAAGKYSYGLYVIHPFVLAFLTAYWLNAGDFERGLGVVVISAALAWLSYNGYEKHFLRLKDRLAPAALAAGQAAPHHMGGPPPLAGAAATHL